MKRTAIACAILLAVVLPACDDDDAPAAPSTPQSAAPPPAPVDIPGPGTTPVPPPSAPSGQAPTLVFKLNPGASGTAPFAVTANMCGSTDPEGARIIYEYKWGGTGGRPIPHFSYFCRDDNVYTEAGVYKAWFCVNDDSDNRVCQNVNIVVN